MTKADEGVVPISQTAAQTVSSAASVGVAEITHDLVRGQLTDYLDDTLGESARHRIDSHLAGCPQCLAFLDTLRATIKALGQLPSPKAPARARLKIVERTRREHG